MIWNVFLVFSLLANTKADDIYATPIYIEAGSHDVITLPLENDNYDDISWFKSQYSTNESHFIGTKLCSNNHYFPSNLKYTCLRNHFYLYEVSNDYDGLFNAKITYNSTVLNFYYNLTVIAPIKFPSCFVLSEYLTNDYCLIRINCTQNPLKTTILYNHTQSDWMLNIKHSPNMPSNYQTKVTYRTFTKLFSHSYPFSELCTTAEYETLESLDDFESIAIAATAICLCLTIAGCVYLYIQRRILLSLCSCSHSPEEKIKISTLY